MSTATKMSEQKQKLTTNKSFEIRGCQQKRKLEKLERHFKKAQQE